MNIGINHIQGINFITVQTMSDDEIIDCNHAGFETEKQILSTMYNGVLDEYETDNDIYYCDKCELKSFDLIDWS